MNNQKPRFRVIAFFDGRPGHEKQTQGILHALQESVELEINTFQVPHKTLWSSVLEHLNLFLPLWGSALYTWPEADILIGSGSRTHPALLMAKRQTGFPAVTCMTPSGILQNKFDLIFAPKHDRITARKNVVFTVGPPNCARVSVKKSSNRGLILIGGTDSKSHFWDSGAIEEYVRQIVQREPEVIWTVSSSPRTPADTVQRLSVLESEFRNLHFFRFEDTASGWIEAQYDECEKVWVTADSVSMVYEALSAGCRVGLLPIRWRKNNNKFMRSVDYLIRESMVISYSRWFSGGETWQKAEPLIEAQHCAEEILKRWLPRN